MTHPGLEPEAAPAAASQEPEASIAALHPVPWEDAGLSRLPGLFRTLGQVLFHPRDFFQNMPREGWAEALAFGLIVGTAGMLAFLYWQLLFHLGLGRGLEELSGMPRLFRMGAGAIMTMMLLAPATMLTYLAISSLGLWAAVALTGGPGPGFTAIWRITCYAQGALLAGFLPLLGGPVAGFWVLILTCRGLQGVLELSFWRALVTLGISLGLQVLLVLLLLLSLTGFWVFRV